jgi:hypothetical protein
MPARKPPESREKTDKSGRAGIPTRPDFLWSHVEAAPSGRFAAAPLLFGTLKSLVFRAFPQHIWKKPQFLALF